MQRTDAITTSDDASSSTLPVPTQRVLLCGWRFMVWPLVALISMFLLLDLTGLDLTIAHFWYQLEGAQWALKENFWTSSVFHSGARTLNQLVIGALLLVWLSRAVRYRFGQRAEPAQQFSQRMLGLLVLSLLLSIGLISLLKKLVPMDCPWDLQLFGGMQPLISLWQHRPASMPNTQCFPAGHASSGYAWLALYFYFLYTRPWLRKVGLAFGIVAGASLGLVQQLRGAHFFSHDIVTALICYVVPAFIFARFQFKTAAPTIRYDQTPSAATAHKELPHA